jgi:hypothetical protein
MKSVLLAVAAVADTSVADPVEQVVLPSLVLLAVEAAVADLR